VSTAEQFAQHLASQVDPGKVYTSKLPARPESADDQWSVVADGGEGETGGNILRWKRVVNLKVSYRHRSSKAVYDADAVLLASATSFQATQSGSVLSVAVVPMSDTDEDSEGRHTASWQVQLIITTK
jgi:hypothetical protein